MVSNISLTGDLPQGGLEGVKTLEQELGFGISPKGTPVEVNKGDHLSVVCDGSTVAITWAEPIQFSRALSLIPLDLNPCDIHEHPVFTSTGVMFDCSRNAVLTVDALKGFLRKMALMGLNLGMMYTEDTYEVPEQPWFGYKRGRYTYNELKELDDYAYALGIELIPCIQCLGHLDRVMRWPAYYDIRESAKIILPDVERTYEVLEQMIRAASAPYRSKRIHLGMDEAWGLGYGAHLNKFGYENPQHIMARHLKRLLDICDKYGLKGMMWSDMYYQNDGMHYHDPRPLSPEAIAAVDPRITLVYWDYYQSDETKYTEELQKHAQFPAETVFAGGIWTWIGPAPSYPTTIANTVAALDGCRKAGCQFVFATCWGDDGQECNMTAALYGMQLYGEMTYKGEYNEENVRARFRRCCHSDPQAFLDLSELNLVPGMKGLHNDPSNACKLALYQDPLVQIHEADLEGFPCAEHYEALTQKFARYAQENPEYALFFDFYTALSYALSLKCRWHRDAARAVREKDRDLAAALCEEIPGTMAAVEALRIQWRALWESTNKPFGFEVLDLRLGGIIARLSTAGQRMQDFAQGKVEDIPELSSETFRFKRREDDSISCACRFDIVTAARLSHPF